jgi:hypothetical protein
MIRLFLFILLLVGCSQLYSQYVLTGTVKDEAGHAVPGARVAVKNTTYGVPTSLKGNYFLELEERGKVVVEVTMIGFEPRIDSVELSYSSTTLDFVLVESATSLNTVEIYADNKDIAKKVMKKVIDNKKELKSSYESYQCKTYIKTSLEKEHRFPQLNANSENPEPEGRQKMNFIESYSITKFKRSNTYKEEIVAHHDYAEKSNSSVVVTADFNDPNSLLPTQVISYNPYIFFEKVEDGDFDPYQNLIDLPKVSEKQLVSPLAVNAFVNYKFTLNNIFYEDGQKIYDINVNPRFKESPLFSGNLFIIDSLWVIKSMDLAVNPSAMDYFKDFRIIQDFENIDGNWVPSRREFVYTINDGLYQVMANTRADHTNYEFDLEFDNKEFKNEIMVYADDAFDKDSAYWADIRPIRLKPEELDFIHEQDSIERELTSDRYVDSVNAEFNRVTFWDVVLNGVGFRSREKAQSFYIGGLISQPQFFGVGGYRHRIAARYDKEFKNAHAIGVDGRIDYGFANKDLKGNLSVEYTYLPKRFGSLRVSGGDIYDYVNTYESIASSFSRNNMVRKTYFGLSQRYEIVNGLYGRLSYDYSTRVSIDDLQLNPWIDTIFTALGIDNTPQPFETYTVSIFELELLYRFKQKYVIKKGKKIIVGTKFPEIMLKYKRGVPGLFGSDVNFDHLEIGASDEVELATFGNLKWQVVGGTFFGSNIDQIRFIEHKFFRQSDRLFFSNPLKSLQTLDLSDTNTINHTARPYLQLNAIHHFNGAIMGKIPLINKLKLELVTGGAALFIEESNFRQLEMYFGLERKFKIKRQLFKIGTYYVLRENSTGGFSVSNDPLLGFKIGIDFFNSWNNSWSY